MAGDLLRGCVLSGDDIRLQGQLLYIKSEEIIMVRFR